MATLAISTLIKAGLAAVVTGVAIATPFVLKRNGGDSPSTSQNSDSSGRSEDTKNVLKPDSDDSRALTSLNDSQDSFGAKGSTGERGNSMSTPNPAKPDNSLESIKQSVISGPTSTLKDKFKKKCFIVPAESNNNAQLLTCLDKEIVEGVREEHGEYDGTFHLYDPSKNDVPLEVEGKLKWNPSEKQISIQMEKSPEQEPAKEKIDYIFQIANNSWDSVSKNEMNLLGQCTPFNNDFEGFSNSEYLLVCGDDLETLGHNTPKGISLILWKLNQ